MKRLFFYGGIVLSMLVGSILLLAHAEQKGNQDSKEEVKIDEPKDEGNSPDEWMRQDNPFGETERMHQQMNRMMHRHLRMRPAGMGPFGSSVYMQPRVDMEETDKELIIRCDLPGIEKDKIELSLKEDVVVIKGMHQVIQEQRKDEKGVRVYRSERSMGSFYRAIPLPVHVDDKNAKANYENGVLTIVLPKMVTQEKGTSIQIT